MTYKFDAVLVGAGQAAPSLANRLAKAGWKIAFIERKRFGGTCVNTGCMPTKTLVASARAAHVARRAADFGVIFSGPIQMDMVQVKARKDKIVQDASKGVEQSLRSLDGCTVFTGSARFESPRSLRVGDDLIEADKIFLNVGCRAAIPDIPGLRETPFLTNSSILELDRLPEHLVILGGSYVGLEFGQIFRRFGSEVTILERGERLLRREDEDVALAIRNIFEGEGINVRTSARPNLIWQKGKSIHVKFDGGEVSGSHLLVAAGRVPNTDDLGLEHAGVQVDSRGFIPVNDHLETSVPGIWALGDCNGRSAFTHTSYNDYEIAAANLLDGEGRKISDRLSAYNIYIDPPLGRAGLTEAEVRSSGKKALIGVRQMTRVNRAVERAETLGFLKVLVDAESGLLLGASLLGVECDEVIHCLLDVMYARKPYTLVTHAVHIHPTVSELIPTVLEELKPL